MRPVNISSRYLPFSRLPVKNVLYPVLQVFQNISKNYCSWLYLFVEQAHAIYSKMYTLSRAVTHYDVTDLEVHDFMSLK